MFDLLGKVNVMNEVAHKRPNIFSYVRPMFLTSMRVPVIILTKFGDDDISVKARAMMEDFSKRYAAVFIEADAKCLKTVESTATSHVPSFHRQPEGGPPQLYVHAPDVVHSKIMTPMYKLGTGYAGLAAMETYLSRNVQPMPAELSPLLSQRNARDAAEAAQTPSALAVAEQKTLAEKLMAKLTRNSASAPAAPNPKPEPKKKECSGDQCLRLS
eukprot:GHVT01042830.1.p1 GENE.GHVT01042830.1~~GHVT01042830.1.p1  ORF type:complete len:214 (+),score=44.13 GHVT01042830.1:674-1315(+)